MRARLKAREETRLDVRLLLSQTSLFAGLAPEALDRLAACTQLRAVASGETLIAPGTPADYLYIVAVGRLRVLLPDGTPIAEIARLEPTGEISLLSGEERSATVYAVRDSKVMQIGREALFEILHAHPAALFEISRTIISRLRQNQRAAALAAVRRSRSFALIAATPGIDLRRFASEFQAALSTCGSVDILDAARVDAVLGTGAADAPIGDGDIEERLIDW